MSLTSISIFNYYFDFVFTNWQQASHNDVICSMFANDSGLQPRVYSGVAINTYWNRVWTFTKIFQVTFTNY